MDQRGHDVNLPVDAVNGKITGARSHSPVSFEKEFDSATPYLYKAVAKRRTLRSAEKKGKSYFVMTLEGVKICGINPDMTNTKLAQASALNHVEPVSMMYDRITWHYLDGNIKYTDSRNERGETGA
ncbi:type VI secretion system tube protein TssD [Paraburkholderia antibiotica]|uniref:type VI secretion system tube protein TssD n=1 Tax=Paraburkholderia antibiotica TaxID=2728839 RepID=UPI002E36913A|nr:type VI secretion system tube protein TssD [Paraburkholderia antibiotica]